MRNLSFTHHWAPDTSRVNCIAPVEFCKVPKLYQMYRP
uniref:Uncharacterized protein n=1 Tax=Arundo donax TaxID=35708 RepID=A0A0A9AJ55_ARUDO